MAKCLYNLCPLWFSKNRVFYKNVKTKTLKKVSLQFMPKKSGHTPGFWPLYLGREKSLKPQLEALCLYTFAHLTTFSYSIKIKLKLYTIIHKQVYINKNRVKKWAFGQCRKDVNRKEKNYANFNLRITWHWNLYCCLFYRRSSL